MTNFVKSAIKQKSNKLINLDVVAQITHGKNPAGARFIKFHFADKDAITWTYDNEQVFSRELSVIESLFSKPL